MMIGAGGVVTCDGCGKTGTGKEIVRGGIGRYGEEVSFHQSFDFCVDSQACFAFAALDAAKGYIKNTEVERPRKPKKL